MTFPLPDDVQAKVDAGQVDTRHPDDIDIRRCSGCGQWDVYEMTTSPGVWVCETCGQSSEPQEPLPFTTGKFHGRDATDTEREAGVAKEIEDIGPLKPGKLGHKMLRVYADGERLTAYAASYRECGDYHGRRREVRRLYDRGLLAKAGTLPNPAVNGRPHVDAFVITESGKTELQRLDQA